MLILIGSALELALELGDSSSELANSNTDAPVGMESSAEYP